MKIYNFENEQDWLEARKTKITGSRLKDVITFRGTTKKQEYYELLAERLALPPTDENAMDRGLRLEADAIERFALETGKKVDSSLALWVRDDNESIAISPDGRIGKTEAIEVKCLGSARHIEALLTGKVPGDYEYQALQYFIVNDELKTLYFAFYDPRLSVKDFFYFTINREDKAVEIEEYKTYQENTLKEINEIVNKLTF